MNNLITVAPSPHFKSRTTTRSIMLDVIIALMPASAAAVVLFGLNALWQICVSVACAVISEFLFNLICKKKQTVGDLSAVVTGVILALSLPSEVPLWQTALGAAAAIVFVKGCFGGIGQNFANPAATARIILLLSFTSDIAKTVDPVIGGITSSATPLAAEISATEAVPSLTDMLIGLRPGAIGEGCIAAIVIGGAYLIIRGVISWHAPVAYVGTVFILSLIWKDGSLYEAVYQILGGGLVFGAVFMATDYATTPKNRFGKLVFGIGCGLITFAIRAWGNYPEGVSYALLLMNILTPYIEKWTRRTPFGAGGANKRRKAET